MTGIFRKAVTAKESEKDEDDDEDDASVSLEK